MLLRADALMLLQAKLCSHSADPRRMLVRSASRFIREALHERLYTRGFTREATCIYGPFISYFQCQPTRGVCVRGEPPVYICRGEPPVYICRGEPHPRQTRSEGLKVHQWMPCLALADLLPLALKRATDSGRWAGSRRSSVARPPLLLPSRPLQLTDTRQSAARRSASSATGCCRPFRASDSPSSTNLG